jgi:hypothetical protein
LPRLANHKQNQKSGERGIRSSSLSS